MTMTGLDRAQAAYDAMEPPEAPECFCNRWLCYHCGGTYDQPGTCPDMACASSAEADREGPRTLAELDDDYLLREPDLVAAGCPAHEGCTCGDERCRECG